MAFRDIPTINPYLRQFAHGPATQYIFSAHGLWRPAKEGMTRVNYTYYWYTQPTETLSYAAYLHKLPSMGIAEPVDIFGPKSGSVANMLLIPLEQKLFGLTASSFQKQVKTSNPFGLSLLAFHGNHIVPGMSLDMLDKQLLPALKYPVHQPVHMVVCRSLNMKKAIPVVKKNVVVIGPAITPFNSISNEML